MYSYTNRPFFPTYNQLSPGVPQMYCKSENQTESFHQFFLPPSVSNQS